MPAKPETETETGTEHGRGWRYALPAVLLLAVLVRLAALALFPHIFQYQDTGQIHGSTAYDIYAGNLLATGVYGRVAGVPDAIIPPLYSYALAAVYAVAGRSGWSVGLFHTALDALSILLLYHIAVRLFPRPMGARVGLLGGLFYAGYPYLVFQNLTLNDTALYMTLLHAFLLVMILLRGQPALTRRTLLLAVLGGVILGVTTLGRALLPPLALLVAVWFLFRLSLAQTVLRLLPVALLSLAVLLPWMLRGYGLYGGFVAVALNSGENIFQGANDQTIPLFRAGYDVQWSDPPPGGENITDPYARNAFLLQAGLDWLRRHPEKIPELLWVKFQVHWSMEVAPRRNPLPGEDFTLDAAGNLVIRQDSTVAKQDIEVIAAYSGGLFDQVGRPLHVVYFGGLLLLALAGIALTGRQWREVALLWFVQLNMTAL
ncbi:MAG: glycosyltransferase family 39 protein, partial [Anaerolineae bacterium]|nr:glycosyltransferase family 39 protein [Anaerolineae bacterium]